MARRAVRREIIFWLGHTRIARSRQALGFAFGRQAQWSGVFARGLILMMNG